MPDTEFRHGHRERLKEKLLDNQLTSAEKLELLLTYAIPRRDVRPLARSLIQRFGGVYFVFTASLSELLACDGIGRNTALLIKLVYELMLVSYQERMMQGRLLDNTKLITDYCRMLLVGKSVEEFHVLYLGADHRLIMDELHSSGTFNQASVYPREIARRALDMNAISVILVHNHPMSGNEFSYDDIEITDQIESGLNLFNIILIDHYLVNTYGDVLSIRARPLLKSAQLKK